MYALRPFAETVGLVDRPGELDRACRGAQLLILNTPANPHGKVWSADELAVLADIICRHDTLLVTDVGEIEILPELPSQPLPAEHAPLASILTHVLDEFGLLYEGLERHYDDAVWVAYRVIEVLPVALEKKQACLESADVLECLKYAQQMVHTQDSR